MVRLKDHKVLKLHLPKITTWLELHMWQSMKLLSLSKRKGNDIDEVDVEVKEDKKKRNVMQGDVIGN